MFSPTVYYIKIIPQSLQQPSCYKFNNSPKVNSKERSGPQRSTLWSKSSPWSSDDLISKIFGKQPQQPSWVATRSTNYHATSTPERLHLNSHHGYIPSSPRAYPSSPRRNTKLQLREPSSIEKLFFLSTRLFFPLSFRFCLLLVFCFSEVRIFKSYLPFLAFLTSVFLPKTNTLLASLFLLSQLFASLFLPASARTLHHLCFYLNPPTSWFGLPYYRFYPHFLFRELWRESSLKPSSLFPHLSFRSLFPPQKLKG